MSDNPIGIVNETKYKSAKQYIPPHWFNIIFDTPDTIRSDSPKSHKYHRLILLNETNYSKIVEDINDYYDNTSVSFMGIIFSIVAALLVFVKSMAVGISATEVIMLAVIIMMTISCTYARSELLRVKKEYALAIVLQLHT